MRFVTWLLTYAVGLAVAAWLLEGIWFDGPANGQAELQEKLLPLLLVALILGLVSTFIEPIIKLLSLPFIILTLGFLLLVINALMLLLTARLAEAFDLGFHVDGFWTALIGSVIVTVVGWGVRTALPARDEALMPAPALPAAREPGRYRIALVCLGNICRSPTAHVVLERRLADAGLADRVEVASSGTGGWHVGNPMDPRAAATLTAAGYDASRHRARQYDATWPEAYDLVLVMDEANLADVGGRTERVGLFRDLDPVDPGGEVPDPYYGGDDGFEEVLTMVERTSDAIVAALPAALGAGTDGGRA